MQVRLLRRSDLRPQRIMGVVGQKWRTSGYHCSHSQYALKYGIGEEAYLVQHVLERVRAVDSEAHEEQVGLWV